MGRGVIVDWGLVSIAQALALASNMEFFNGIGGDPYKPSLFELLAQEQLRDLLQPALKYILSVRTAKYTFST